MAAKHVCQQCPALKPCREEGLLEELGVWGGLDPSDRARLKVVKGPVRGRRVLGPPPVPRMLAASRALPLASGLGGIVGMRVSALTDADALKLSSGEVTAAETINYRTGQPVRDGLFAEEIFGAAQPLRCACSHLQGLGTIGERCERCGVVVELAGLRRERLGHIVLARPVAHPLFLWANPSPLALALGVKRHVARAIAHGYLSVLQEAELLPWRNILTLVTRLGEHEAASFRRYLDQLLSEHDDEAITDAELADRREAAARALREVRTLIDRSQPLVRARAARGERLAAGDLLDSDALRLLALIGVDVEASTGGEALRFLLGRLDLEAEVRRLQDELRAKRPKGPVWRLQRAQLLQTLLDQGGVPDGWVIGVLPVLPPGLRPLIVGGSRGSGYSSDLNPLYLRVLRANQRLRKIAARQAPRLLTAQAYGTLQMSVDSLFLRPAPDQREPKREHLTEALRRSFLRAGRGKRVDFSARGPAVPDPAVPVGQCVLPREMATLLFEPLLASSASTGHADDASLVLGRDMLIARVPPLAQSHVQGFTVAGLCDSPTVRLHPLALRGLSVRPGDAVALFVPLGDEARRETRTMMSAIAGSFWDGPAAALRQDKVVADFVRGASRLERPVGGYRRFSSERRLLEAWDAGLIRFREPVLLGSPPSWRTSVGRLVLARAAGQVDVARCNRDLDIEAYLDLIRDTQNREAHEAPALLSRIFALAYDSRLARAAAPEPPDDSRNPISYWQHAQESRQRQVRGWLEMRAVKELMRDLVYALGGIRVSEVDCGAPPDLPVRWSEDPPTALAGRTVALESGAPELVEHAHIKSWQARAIHEVRRRSAVRCRASGVCQACYGQPADLGRVPAVGEPVGVDAAQALVGPLIEPIGGKGLGDRELQYLEALLDVAQARAPRNPAAIAPVEGVVRIEDRKAMVRLERPSGDDLLVRLRPGVPLLVKDGDRVAPGDPLTAGAINPHRVLHLAGLKRVADLLVARLLGVLAGAGVSLQHGELLVRIVLSLCRVDDHGDAPIRTGDYVTHQTSARLAHSGTPVAAATPVVLSCREVVRHTESWLGAAARGAIPKALVDGVLSGETAMFDQPRIRMLLGSPVQRASRTEAPVEPPGMS